MHTLTFAYLCVYATITDSDVPDIIHCNKGPSFWEKKELLFLTMHNVEKKEEYRINILYNIYTCAT